MNVINGIKVKKLIRVIYPLAIKPRGGCAGAAVPATLPGVNTQYLGLLWQSWERFLPITAARGLPTGAGAGSGLGAGGTYLRNRRAFHQPLRPQESKGQQPPNTRWLTAKKERLRKGKRLA